jgi:hypothetical protein
MDMVWHWNVPQCQFCRAWASAYHHNVPAGCCHLPRACCLPASAVDFSYRWLRCCVEPGDIAGIPYLEENRARACLRAVPTLPAPARHGDGSATRSYRRLVLVRTWFAVGCVWAVAHARTSSPAYLLLPLFLVPAPHLRVNAPSSGTGLSIAPSSLACCSADHFVAFDLPHRSLWC